MRSFILLLLIFVGMNISSQGLFSIRPERLLGQIIKLNLENIHYRKLKIDDNLSQKSFEKFIEKVDYSKNFFLEEDIKNLSKDRLHFDNFLSKGEYPILEKVMKIKSRRIQEASKRVKKLLKKGLNFSRNESLELDSKKRSFSKNKQEFNDLWRRIVKQSTLSRYMLKLEEQEVLKKNKKKSPLKYKKEKIFSRKKILKKTYVEMSKRYKKYFKRELDESRNDYFEKFLNSITEIFDPHTSYFPPRKKEDFDIEMSGSLEGIGANLLEDEDYIKVAGIVPGGAAWRQKELSVDDKILAVESKSKGLVDLVGMKIGDAVRYIRGKKGTVVKLHVQKTDGQRKIIPIERDVIIIAEYFTKSSILELKGLKLKIGYIYIPKFYREFGGKINCTDDVRNELRRLRKKNVDALILDLRGNGGGALSDASDMSGLFISRGPIVQIRDRENRVYTMEDRDARIEFARPLIVMVNRLSASASEILAAALQDYKRAVIVGGYNTHGKGTVQTIKGLDQNILLGDAGKNLGALKVTIQKFYRINGRSTQYKGITPDIVIPDPYEYLENREKDYKYSLPWDMIAPLTFNVWKKQQYKLDLLKERSRLRILKNKRMQKLIGDLKYLNKRKKDTKITLNIKKLRKKEKENKKYSERMKVNEGNKNLTVSNFEASLKSHSKIKKGEEKQWKKDFKKRKKDWIKTLREDVGLEEAMYIIADMVNKVYQK